MLWRLRSFWMASALLLYLGVAAVRSAPGDRAVWLGAALGLCALVAGFRLAAPPPTGPDHIHPIARSAARVTATGAALVLVARLSPAMPSFEAVAVAGLAAACIAALVAQARVTSLGGIAARPARSGADALIAASLLWIAGLAVALWRVVDPAAVARLHSAAMQYALVAASLGSIGVMLVTSYRLYASRRFELGVAERAAAALWLALLCLVVGTFAALMAVAEPERVVPATALAAALCTTMASASQQPTLVSRAMRTAAALVLLCAPVVCVAVVAAYKAPTHAGLILFVVTITAGLLGLAAPRLADRLGPERGAWLRVMQAAVEVAKQPDPRQAVVSVLATIRDGMGADEGPAALHRFSSRDRLVVDRAGYLHTEEASVPDELVELARIEPRAVVATEALRYVEVVKPEVRPLVAWLDAKGAGAATLVIDEDVDVGLLLWPAAGRTTPLSSEEVDGLRRLADHLGSVTGAAAQLARSRARELEASQAMVEAEERLQVLERTIERGAALRRGHAELLARPARVASYSPAAQEALMRAERLGQADLPFAMVVPPGVEPLPWAAVAHLASPRGDGPLVIVDATLPAEQPIERYRDEGSPLELARGGTLVLRDPQVLPHDTQRFIANALPRDVGVIALLPRPVSTMEVAGELCDHLADKLGERALELPALRARAEDLRALSLFMLSRIGIRLRGQPLGLTLEAQELVNELRWPGNDLQLEAALLRAALATDGDAVGRDVLEEAIGTLDRDESGPIRRAAAR